MKCSNILCDNELSPDAPFQMMYKACSEECYEAIAITELPTRKDVMTKQVGGSHYKKNRIQPWDIIDEYGLDFYEGNALKYLLRDKSETDAGKRKEDLEKAIHYIEKKLTEWDDHPSQGRLDLCDGMHGTAISGKDIT